MPTATPKLTPQEYGRIGAQRRWGEPRTATVRIDSLTPDQRRLVLALLDAVRVTNETAAPTGENVGTASVGEGNHDAPVPTT